MFGGESVVSPGGASSFPPVVVIGEPEGRAAQHGAQPPMQNLPSQDAGAATAGESSVTATGAGAAPMGYGNAAATASSFGKISVEHVNLLLQICNIDRTEPIHSLKQCSSSLFVLLYERLLGVTIVDIEREPNTNEKKLRNMRHVLNELEHVLQINLTSETTMEPVSSAPEASTTAPSPSGHRNAGTIPAPALQPVKNQYFISAQEVLNQNEDHIARLVHLFLLLAWQVNKDVRSAATEVVKAVSGMSGTAPGQPATTDTDEGRGDSVAAHSTGRYAPDLMNAGEGPKRNIGAGAASGVMYVDPDAAYYAYAYDDSGEPVAPHGAVRVPYPVQPYPFHPEMYRFAPGIVQKQPAKGGALTQPTHLHTTGPHPIAVHGVASSHPPATAGQPAGGRRPPGKEVVGHKGGAARPDPRSGSAGAVRGKGTAAAGLAPPPPPHTVPTQESGIVTMQAYPFPHQYYPIPIPGENPLYFTVVDGMNPTGGVVYHDPATGAVVEDATGSTSVDDVAVETNDLVQEWRQNVILPPKKERARRQQLRMTDVRQRLAALTGEEIEGGVPKRRTAASSPHGKAHGTTPSTALGKRNASAAAPPRGSAKRTASKTGRTQRARDASNRRQAPASGSGAKLGAQPQGRQLNLREKEQQQTQLVAQYNPQLYAASHDTAEGADRPAADHYEPTGVAGANVNESMHYTQHAPQYYYYYPSDYGYYPPYAAGSVEGEAWKQMQDGERATDSNAMPVEEKQRTTPPLTHANRYSQPASATIPEREAPSKEPHQKSSIDVQTLLAHNRGGVGARDDRRHQEPLLRDQARTILSQLQREEVETYDSFLRHSKTDQGVQLKPRFTGTSHSSSPAKVPPSEDETQVGHEHSKPTTTTRPGEQDDDNDDDDETVYFFVDEQGNRRALTKDQIPAGVPMFDVDRGEFVSETDREGRKRADRSQSRYPAATADNEDDGEPAAKPAAKTSASAKGSRTKAQPSSKRENTKHQEDVRNRAQQSYRVPRIIDYEARDALIEQLRALRLVDDMQKEVRRHVLRHKWSKEAALRQQIEEAYRKTRVEKAELQNEVREANDMNRRAYVAMLENACNEMDDVLRTCDTNTAYAKITKATTQGKPPRSKLGVAASVMTERTARATRRQLELLQHAEWLSEELIQANKEEMYRDVSAFANRVTTWQRCLPVASVM